MKRLILGCLTLIAIAVICIIGLVVSSFIERPKLQASLQGPSVVAFDSTFDYVIVVTNPHDKTVKLDSIDIGNSFLEGFQVVQIDPEPESTMQIFGMRTWGFSKPVNAGDSLSVRFTFKAVQEGHYSGDIDVCNPNQDFETLVGDIVVRGADWTDPALSNPPAFAEAPVQVDPYNTPTLVLSP